jgi:hypothetical protein
MPKNKLNSKPLKFRIGPYAVVFALYLVALMIVFFYSLRFLKRSVNLVFDPLIPQAIDSDYTGLNLSAYALLTDKLGLINPVNSNLSASGSDIMASSSTVAASSSDMTASSSSEVLSPATTSNTETTVSSTVSSITSSIILQNKADLKISVINSTDTNGLANNLKKQLNAAGYSTVSAGNQKPTEANTILKIKASLSADSTIISEIKNIISAKYNFTLATLPAESQNDFEIVIGQQ